MQKYGKIRKLPRLPTKKIAEKFYTMLFCYIDYASFAHTVHFRTTPLERGFALFYPLWWRLRMFHAIIALYGLWNTPLSAAVLHQFSASLGAFS